MPPYSDPIIMDESISSASSSIELVKPPKMMASEGEASIEESTTSSVSAANESQCPPRPSIHFSPFAEYREVKHIADYTDEDVCNTWYNENEYRRIKRSCKASVKMMAAGWAVDKDDPDFCYRGLECRTKEGSRLRTRRRQDIRVIVCFEQLELTDMITGTCDAEALAKKAQDASVVCSLDAVSRALVDEIQANQIYGRHGGAGEKTGINDGKNVMTSLVRPASLVNCIQKTVHVHDW